MKFNISSILYFAATILAANVSLASVNLIDLKHGIGAGSFELGVYQKNSANAWDYMRLGEGDATIVGWTVGNTYGIDWGNSPSILAYDGTKSVDLSGVGLGSTISPGSIRTSIDTVTGAQYLITFWAYGGDEDHSGLLTAGTLSQAFTAKGMMAPTRSDYQYFEYIFTAIDFETIVTFQSTDGYGFGPVIDDVSVFAIPEPKIYISLLALAVALVAVVRRRALA